MAVCLVLFLFFSKEAFCYHGDVHGLPIQTNYVHVTERRTTTVPIVNTVTFVNNVFVTNTGVAAATEKRTGSLHVTAARMVPVVKEMLFERTFTKTSARYFTIRYTTTVTSFEIKTLTEYTESCNTTLTIISSDRTETTITTSSTTVFPIKIFVYNDEETLSLTSTEIEYIYTPTTTFSETTQTLFEPNVIITEYYCIGDEEDTTSEEENTSTSSEEENTSTSSEEENTSSEEDTSSGGEITTNKEEIEPVLEAATDTSSISWSVTVVL
ncbi:MAG: uncharacterized protein A8A55_2281 [Amphiamblys sp. WSBS2006]|nr:MAG: uncharacterized protein A8A55_2281 [Amphiamblys sp. WSBS2006]